MHKNGSSYKFCVVVPCYNCVNTLDRTIDSLIKQEKINEIPYKIMLVDDGSNDGTTEKCDWYVEKYENVATVHKSNGGLVDAWKTGVLYSDAQYIAFCDADDYVSHDFLFRLNDTIENNHEPEIIVFGMRCEYENGKSNEKDVRIKEGYYEKNRIDEEVLPELFSDGTMESLLLMGSRCNKVFKRTLLQKVMDDVPNNVSMGEDDITTFLSVLNCDSIYAIRSYYPYHYVRNATSMIGAYDVDVFNRIDLLYSVINDLAGKYGYQYNEQIERDYFSTLVLYMKKEISKSPFGYYKIKNRLDSVHGKDIFKKAISAKYYSRYQGGSKIFAIMMIYRLYYPAFFLVRFIEAFRGIRV